MGVEPLVAYDDGKVREILLPVDGPVNTVDPSASRPPGTLLDAPGCGTRWWGPRRGAKALTSPHALTTKPMAAPRLLSTGDTTTFGGTFMAGRMSPGEQSDLGTEWTFDMVFRITSLSGANNASLFQWWAVAGPLTLSILLFHSGAGNGANAGKIQVSIQTTSAPGTTVTAVDLVSATAPSVGTDADDIHHLRVVRDGASFYIYLDGVLDASATTLSATNPSQTSPTDTEALWRYRSDGSATEMQTWFIQMRTGVFRTAPISRSITPVPLAENCKLCVVFSQMSTVSTLQGYSYVPDLSRYQSHGFIIEGLGTITVAQDTSSTFHRPIQGLSRFVGVDGVRGNAVRCAGSLYWRGMDGS